MKTQIKTITKPGDGIPQKIRNKINPAIDSSMTGFDDEQERLENIVEALRRSLEEYQDYLNEC